MSRGYEVCLADAVVRNLEVIGEAAKGVPATVRKECPDVEWRAISGLRDILIHEYFGVDSDIIRDIVRTKLPSLRARVSAILKRRPAAGKPGVKISARGGRKRRLGILAGRFKVPDDFDAPLEGI